MTVYFDTSALVKLYVPEPETGLLSSFVASRKESILFSHLHELELKNALRLKVFRKEATPPTVLKCARAIDKDLRLGVLKRPELNWPDVFRRADELSKRFSSRSGFRSLDLLHVASCMVIGCRDLITFDERQIMLARKARIRVVSVK